MAGHLNASYGKMLRQKFVSLRVAVVASARGGGEGGNLSVALSHMLGV